MFAEPVPRSGANADTTLWFLAIAEPVDEEVTNDGDLRTVDGYEDMDVANMIEEKVW